MFPGSNQVTSIVPTESTADTQELRAVPRLRARHQLCGDQGNSDTTVSRPKSKSSSNGLNFLLTYTYSKTLSDAGDLLNGGSSPGISARRMFPELGIQADYGLANFDIRNVFHFSGGYELPFGKGKHFMSEAEDW